MIKAIIVASSSAASEYKDKVGVKKKPIAVEYCVVEIDRATHPLRFTTNQALDDVNYGLKDPNLALDEAAARSATALGW